MVTGEEWHGEAWTGHCISVDPKKDLGEFVDQSDFVGVQYGTL